jgi:hypothetical protein
MVNFPSGVNNATVASYFLFGLEAGMFEADCAKDWAFKIVELSQNPPIDIIDVATANRREEVFDVLSLVVGERNNQLAGKWLLHSLYNKIQADPASLERVIKQAMQVSSSCGLPRDVYYSLDGIDDELFLAKNGTYGTVEQCRQELIATLTEFGINPNVET